MATNKSFEGAGTNQGEAGAWTVATLSEQIGAAAFEDTTVSFDPWEDMEEQWRLPLLVHQAIDGANTVTSPDASDLPTSIALCNEAAANYEAHRALTTTQASIENSADETWNISDGATLTLKIDRGVEQTLILLGLTPTAATAEEVADSINTQLLGGHAEVTFGGLRITIFSDRGGLGSFVEVTGGTANSQILLPTWEVQGAHDVHLSVDTHADSFLFFFPATDLSETIALTQDLKDALNNHIWQYPDVHRKWDKDAAITSPDPSDLPSVILALNEIKTDFNAHIARTGAGDFNESGAFDWDDVTEGVGIFDPDLEEESFDRGWSIPDLFPVVADQADMVNVDGPAVPITSWPDGHIEFLDTLEYIPVEVGIREDFEAAWFLPGSISTFPNDEFLIRYWDGTEFLFGPVQTDPAAEENFEAGWKDNDVGLGKYWSGTEWRFSTSAPYHIEGGPMGTATYTLATLDMNTPLSPTLNPGLSDSPPHMVPYLTVEVTTAYSHTETLSLRLTLVDPDGGSNTLDIQLDPPFTLNKTWQFSVLDAVYGVKAVTGITFLSSYSTGAGEFTFAGPNKSIETFEQDWTLTLE
jgi:hypothetical protein